MKKYLKYRDFIPKEFVEKIQSKESEENKKGYKILMLLNIILLLFNLESIYKQRDEKEYIPEANKKYIEKEEILKWINLYDEDSINFRILNNTAEITYEKDKNIKEIEKLGARIKKVTNYDDKRVVNISYE